jgi:hypothetical protein
MTRLLQNTISYAKSLCTIWISRDFSRAFHGERHRLRMAIGEKLSFSKSKRGHMAENSSAFSVGETISPQAKTEIHENSANGALPGSFASFDKKELQTIRFQPEKGNGAIGGAPLTEVNHDENGEVKSLTLAPGNLDSGDNAYKKQQSIATAEISPNEHDADIVNATHFNQLSNIITSAFGASVGSIRNIEFSKGMPDFKGEANAFGRGLKYGVGDQIVNAGLDGVFGSASNKAFLTDDKESFVIGAEAALPIHPGARRAVIAATWVAFRAYNYYEKK